MTDTPDKPAELEPAGDCAFLFEVINALPCEVVVRDRDSRIIFANDAFAASYNSTRQALLGSLDRENWASRGRSAEEIENWLAEDRQVIEAGSTMDYIQEIQRPGGETVYFHNVKLPFTLADGTRCVLAMYYEVTEQRRHDNELRSAQAAAAELEGIHKTTVTYAHEVNNPLTAILANTQILLDNEELGAMEYSSEILDMLQDINAAALRIRDVIQKMENLHTAKTRPYLDRSELIDLRGDEPSE